MKIIITFGIFSTPKEEEVEFIYVPHPLVYFPQHII